MKISGEIYHTISADMKGQKNDGEMTVSRSAQQSVTTTCAKTLANISPALNSTSSIQPERLQDTHQLLSPSFPSEYQLAAFIHLAHSTMPVSNYSSYTMNNYFKSPPSTPQKGHVDGLTC